MVFLLRFDAGFRFTFGMRNGQHNFDIAHDLVLPDLLRSCY